MSKRLGNKIKTLRRQNRLTQTELAKVLGTIRSTLASWETGRREPDHDTLAKMADCFQVTLDYLLGRTDEPEKARKLEIPFNVITSATITPTDIGVILEKVNNASDEESMDPSAKTNPNVMQFLELLNRLTPEELLAIYAYAQKLYSSRAWAIMDKGMKENSATSENIA